MLSFYAVHGPIQTTQEKWAKFQEKAKQEGLADQGFKNGRYQPMRQHQDNPVYAGLIEQMDDAIGSVLDKLEKLGLDKNTVIIFTADNGGVSAGDNFSTSNLPLRGGKGYIYEGGIRVPFILKVPSMSAQPDTSNIPISGVDIMPTFLDMANIDPKAYNLSGTSIKQLLANKEQSDRVLIWHYPHYGNQGGEPASAIRKGDWKYIYFWSPKLEPELYNIAADPEEATNCIASHSQLAKQLSDELFTHLKNAQRPTVDPMYNQKKEDAYLTLYLRKCKAKLERARAKMLSTDWQPNKNWWGSKTID